MDLHRLPTNALHGWVRSLFAAMGSAPDEARLAADHLIGANLAGHDSHGVGMIPLYVESLAGGQLALNRRVETVVDSGPMLVLDGGRGVGQAVAHQAMELGIERAREHGVALVGLRNAHHIGRIGHWAEMATAAGLVGIHFTNAVAKTSLVAPHGGAEARFVTNPFTVGVPRAGTDPILLDFATSTIAHGKALVAMRRGVPVPDGTVIDAEGRPTTDPRVLFEPPIGALRTFAGHKGHALSIVCELLGAAMIGGPTGHRANHLPVPGVINNMLAILIDPERLGAGAAFGLEMDELVGWVRSARLDATGEAQGGVLMPGEPEVRSRAERRAHVPLDANTLDGLADAARRAAATGGGGDAPVDPWSLVDGAPSGTGRDASGADAGTAPDGGAPAGSAPEADPAAAPAAGPPRAPTAALLIIGDEILSGRTVDANLAHLATRLGTRGIRTVESRTVADDPDAIVRAVNELRAAHDLVFTTGGIGPTHDDVTADCVARAFGVGIDVDPGARAILAAFCGERGVELNADRLRMARVPDGATLIDNPVSAAPGFRIGNVHVMAGVPSIMRAMLEAVLPTLPEGPVTGSASVVAFGLGEGDIAGPLRDLQERHPDVDVGSYPGRVDGRSRVELVARGTGPERLEALRRELAGLVEAAGGELG